MLIILAVLPTPFKLLPFLYLIFRDKNSSSNMKIDTLSFLNCILVHHSPVVFHPHVKVLVPVSHQYFNQNGFF